jgi:hypothetical protein
MSKLSHEKTRKQRFLALHPFCCFCGGTRHATTIDHVPPQACFPKGYMPESFESPACEECNKESVKQDQIFGLYSMLLDFDESKMKLKKDQNRIAELRQGIANNYPDALPDVTRALPVNRLGSIITPHPVAFSIETTPALKEAIQMTGKKLTHALYLRETGNSLTNLHQFICGAYQPQRDNTQSLTEYFMSLLPNLKVGSRTNIPKEYGDRFRYISGYKDKEDFFSYAAQFGHGIILWGIVCGPGITRPNGGPLGMATWYSGACGAGSRAG